jgi:antitoxin (DNA-binding transcriptional repressor) of toxin-antitoxin stability system
MKIANLANAKNELSKHVAYVRTGGRVRIMVNGIAAADLVPISSTDGSTHDTEMELLE